MPWLRLFAIAIRESTMATSQFRTFADLLRRLGDVPPDRIRFRPFPGTATVQDVNILQEKEGILCELIDGVLVEKIMGYSESLLAAFLISVMNHYVIPRNLGHVTSPDATVELMPDLVRIPDVAFTSWDRLPGRKRPKEPVPRLVPNLAIEILSLSNTPGEMASKRQDYFAAGVELVWEVDPETRTVAVYTSPKAMTTLRDTDTLDGGIVLPGFTLRLHDLFAELDRHG
jgi:Uma2 family endonuclease